MRGGTDWDKGTGRRGISSPRIQWPSVPGSMGFRGQRGRRRRLTRRWGWVWLSSVTTLLRLYLSTRMHGPFRGGASRRSRIHESESFDRPARGDGSSRRRVWELQHILARGVLGRGVVVDGHGGSAPYCRADPRVHVLGRLQPRRRQLGGGPDGYAVDGQRAADRVRSTRPDRLRHPLLAGDRLQLPERWQGPAGHDPEEREVQ